MGTGGDAGLIWQSGRKIPCGPTPNFLPSLSLIQPRQLHQFGYGFLAGPHGFFEVFRRKVGDLAADFSHAGYRFLIMEDVLEGGRQDLHPVRRSSLGDPYPAPEIHHHVVSLLLEGGEDIGDEVHVPLVAELGRAFELPGLFIGPESDRVARGDGHVAPRMAAAVSAFPLAERFLPPSIAFFHFSPKAEA